MGKDQDVRLHQMRHSRITAVASQGWNPQQVMLVSGHRDILPMLILDASARVRSTYRLQAKLVHNVIWLETSNKQYDNVTIRVRERGSGKHAFGKKYWENLREIVEIIRRYPDHKPLVLHHKPDPKAKIGDVQTDLNHILKQPQGLDASVPPGSGCAPALLAKKLIEQAKAIWVSAVQGA